MLTDKRHRMTEVVERIDEVDAGANPDKSTFQIMEFDGLRQRPTEKRSEVLATERRKRRKAEPTTPR